MEFVFYYNKMSIVICKLIYKIKYRLDGLARYFKWSDCVGYLLVELVIRVNGSGSG